MIKFIIELNRENLDQLYKSLLTSNKSLMGHDSLYHFNVSLMKEINSFLNRKMNWWLEENLFD